jgi:hypothetical protein
MWIRKTMKPNDFGKIFLVEECQKIEINSFLRDAKLKLKQILINSELDSKGLSILLISTRTGFGGERYWFKCPLCERRSGTLFMHPVSQNLGCRGCLGLEYRKRRFKGMVENFLE